MHRRVPSTGTEEISAVKMRSPAWMAVPDEDDAEAVLVQKQVTSVSGTVWYFLTTLAMGVVLLLYAEAPWWLVAIVAAETYASGRRMVSNFYSPETVSSSSDDAAEGPARERRLRHFTSLKLGDGAPIDEIVARFTALDSLKIVRSVELGSNTSRERLSRGHSLGLMATFCGEAERDAFLKCAERAAFLAYIGPYVEESFVFDFESGAV